MAKKIYCRGMRKGKKLVRKSTCATSRCKGQLMGSDKSGNPIRRKRSVCLKSKKKRAAKGGGRSKGVMSHGRMVYGAAADAVRKKRRRPAATKRARKRAAPKRRRVHGRAGMSIGGSAHRHHRHGEVLILKADTGAVIGEGYTVAEAVRHAKQKRKRRSSSARAGSLGRF